MQVLMKLNKRWNPSGWGTKEEVMENVAQKEKVEKYTKRLCPNAPLFPAKDDISNGEEVYYWPLKDMIYDWATSTIRYRNGNFWLKPTRVSWLCELVQGIDGKVDSKS